MPVYVDRFDFDFPPPAGDVVTDLLLQLFLLDPLLLHDGTPHLEHLNETGLEVWLWGIGEEVLDYVDEPKFGPDLCHQHEDLRFSIHHLLNLESRLLGRDWHNASVERHFYALDALSLAELHQLYHPSVATNQDLVLLNKLDILHRK